MTDPILIDVPEEVASERIVVRRFKVGDGEAMFEAVDESREHILPWMPWGPGHATVADSEKMVRSSHARWALREEMPLGIFDRETGRFIGGTGLSRIDWNVRSFEIGYWIRKTAQGHGYVTECVKLLTALAFDELKANRVFIRCAVENIRSSAVAKRAGYIYEGTIRNSIKDASGQLHDALMFSLIPEDWEALRVG
jgi:RimJ/RimL family protein N-acetyltransferase